jgi:hypothetical protein
MPSAGRAPFRFKVLAGMSLAYLGIVLALWAPFGPRSGMPYETTFVWDSETGPLLHGLLYRDRLRAFTAVFYHVSYLLSYALGMPGSFLGYQIVYATLWWARGILSFLILDRLVPDRPLLSYLFGALVVIHASDNALNWVGQINQFGFMAWMLLSFYLLLQGLQSNNTPRSVLLVGLAAGACFLSIFSYESQLFIILATPLLLGSASGGIKRNRAMLALYYVVPCWYILLNVQRYRRGAGSSYQESVLRTDWGFAALVHDLTFNVAASVKFWDWGISLPTSPHSAVVHAIFGSAAVVFCLGAVYVNAIARRRSLAILPSRRQLAWLVGAGMIVLLLSFPAYLLLNSATSLWRTQFLSGIGAALVLASLVGLAGTMLPDGKVRFVWLLATGGVVCFFGARAAYADGWFHYQVWERHRLAIAEVLAVAPRIKPESVIVLVGVPRSSPPFGHNMWFDVALRLAYPHVPVAGVYFWENGQASPGANMVVDAGGWRQTREGFSTMLSKADFSHTVVIQFDRGGAPRLLARVPPFVTSDPAAVPNYNPSAVIMGGPPDPIAIRRYRPIPDAATSRAAAD